MADNLFFVRGGNLMAQRFDPHNRKLLGDPLDLGRRTGIESHNQLGMFAAFPPDPDRVDRDRVRAHSSPLDRLAQPERFVDHVTRSLAVSVP
jgi:hypothetical protein